MDVQHFLRLCTAVPAAGTCCRALHIGVWTHCREGTNWEEAFLQAACPQSLIKHRQAIASSHMSLQHSRQILPDLSATLLICPICLIVLSKHSTFRALLLIKHNKRCSVYYPANTAESCLFLQSTYQFAF